VRRHQSGHAGADDGEPSGWRCHHAFWKAIVVTSASRFGVVQPQRVDLALRGRRHFLGDQHRFVERLRADHGGDRAVVERLPVGLRVIGGANLLGGGELPLAVVVGPRLGDHHAAADGDQRGGRGGHESRAKSTGARCRGHGVRRQRPDGRDVGEHSVAQSRRRVLRHGAADDGRGLTEPVDLGPARGARGEVPLERGPLDVVEGVDGVRADEGMDVAHVVATPIASRIRISPSRILVLAVPTGRSSMVATSVCV
jgi:hypothetical protein